MPEALLCSDHDCSLSHHCTRYREHEERFRLYFDTSPRSGDECFAFWPRPPENSAYDLELELESETIE